MVSEYTDLTAAVLLLDVGAEYSLLTKAPSGFSVSPEHPNKTPPDGKVAAFIFSFPSPGFESNTSRT